MEGHTVITNRCSSSEPTPEHLGGSVKSRCSSCNEEIWISNSTIPHLASADAVLCEVCAAPLLAKNHDAELRAADPEMQRYANMPGFREWMIELGVRNG